VKSIEDRKSYAAIARALLEGGLSPYHQSNFSKMRHPCGWAFREKGGTCGTCALRENEGHGNPLRCGMFHSYKHGAGVHTRSTWHACVHYQRES
jgi:hypothetical protein